MIVISIYFLSFGKNLNKAMECLSYDSPNAVRYAVDGIAILVN